MVNARYSALLTLLLCAFCLPATAQLIVHEINSPTANATGLCWDGAALWVSDYSNIIRRVDPQSGDVIRSITGPVNGSDGLAFENGYLWTVSRVLSDQTIYRLDTLNGAVVDQISDPTNGNSGGAAWETDGLWLSQSFPQNRILKVNTTTEEVVANFSAPGDEPYGMAWDGSALWNSSADDSADGVYRVSPVDGNLLWSFDLEPHSPVPGRRPRGLAWDGQYLWVIAYEVNGWQVKIFQYDVGNAENPDIDLAEYSHEFGGNVIGFPVSWSTTLRNLGNVGLVLDSAHFRIGQSYAILDPGTIPVTIAAEDSVPLTIRFDPQQTGALPDTLVIYSNDPDEGEVSVTLSGTGLPDEGDIDLSPAEIDFGLVRVNRPILSTGRIVEIWNRGSGVLTVSGVEIVGNAFVADPEWWPISIDSSSYFPIRIWFNPTAPTFYEGVVYVTSDDPDEPVIELPVSGTGDDAPVPAGDVLWQYGATGGFDHSINSVQWISDVNADGIADVLAASGNHLVYCLNGSSTGIADTFWTYNTGADPNHSGIVYYERGMHSIPDLTGDDVEDVIIGTSGGSRSVYALSGTTGQELWMFDTREWGSGGWVYEVHPIADIDNDQLPDVLAAAGDDGNGTGPRRVFALSGGDGSLIWSGPATTTFYSVRAIADATGDGLPDVVGGGSDGTLQGLNSSDGQLMWQADVGAGSPVFAFLPMGNANPDVNLTEDVAVASAYDGIYVIDGGTGGQIWFAEQATTFVYEIAIGSDINGDEVNEVYAGTVSGHVRCFDGRTGQLEWSIIADPNSLENVLTLTAIPDVTGDGLMDLVAGTLGEYLVLVNGESGEREWDMQPSPDAIDATGILPDIDGNGSWEILTGSRDGTVLAVSGGASVSATPRPSPSLPHAFQLGPSYPNPFNSVVTIPYSVPQAGEISIKIYDLLGRVVQTLYQGQRQPGTYRVNWEGHSAASGTYIVVLDSPQRQLTSKIMFLK